MNDVVTQDLDSLVRETGARLPAVWSPPRKVVDLVARERKVTYFKIKELSNGWTRVYNEYIQDAIWRTDNIEEAARQLEEVTRSFDKAMTELGPVIPEYQRVTKLLEKLLVTVRKEPRFAVEGKRLERFRLRRRTQIRKHAAGIMRAISDMQDKAANPAWAKRQWQKLWAQVPFEIDEDDEERLKLAANSAAAGLSRMAAQKLNINEDVVAAFATLQLSVWATESEMLDRYTYLMKIYHPDVATGNTEMSKKINVARDTLLGYYAPIHARAA